MTDKEIIKALESLAAYDCTRCLDLGHDCFGEDCDKAIAENALDLINRQQAQIDRLMEECGNQSVLWQRHFDNIFESAKRTTKAEAIKEFAERLTHDLVINNEENTDYFDFAYTLETIDAIKEEMTGETKTDTDFPKDYSYGY